MVIYDSVAKTKRTFKSLCDDRVTVYDDAHLGHAKSALVFDLLRCVLEANGFVTIDGEKMIKSLGNSFFVKDALHVYPGEVLRFYLPGTHYRANFNFNEENLLASRKRLDKLYCLKKRLFGMNAAEEKTAFQGELLAALSDDLNVSAALALVDEMVSAANETLDAEPKNKVVKRETLADLACIETLLGFDAQNPFEYFQFGLDDATKEQISRLVAERAEAKKAKDFARSDALRDEITAYGVPLMDTAQETFWERLG